MTRRGITEPLAKASVCTEGGPEAARLSALGTARLTCGARKVGLSYAAWAYSLIRPLRIFRRWIFIAGRLGVGWAGVGGC